MDYYMEFGGGLGDIFYQIYIEGAYRMLDTLVPQDRARVVLISHNPYVHELFLWHPRGQQIEVRSFGYWLPEDDARMRREHDLPFGRPSYPVLDARVTFYPSTADLAVLDKLVTTNYVVFSVSAGLSDRNIPAETVEALATAAQSRDLLPVFVGRNYDRHGRREYVPAQEAGLNLIDQLSVPGVARLVERAAGLVCCHSAANILGWLMRKPQLLLYPEAVYHRHIAQRDQWSFGTDFPECYHASFNDLRVATMVDEFFSQLSPCSSSVAGNAVVCEKQHVGTIPLPPESQSIELDEGIPRLTSATEVKFLCWLARQIDGNIVEIGCNKGLTTRDLARTNPNKIVYAVDYFVSRPSCNVWQEAERPSPDDFCVHARELENVVVLHADSARLNYGALRDVKLIFIDGDHTFEHVRADSEQARHFLEKNGGGWIVWHDYYDDGPSWVGVQRYVDSLDLAVDRVAGTWLALGRI
jgi:Methyltransferase domain